MSIEGNPQGKAEILLLPEVVVQEEHGAQLLSLLKKASDPSWGETDTPLAKETTKYFEEHPIDPTVVEVLRSFEEQGVDEETLYNFALTYQHPERVAHIFKLIAAHKPHVKQPKETHKILVGLLDTFDAPFAISPLCGVLRMEATHDKAERVRRMEETKEWLKRLIDFFKPDPKTSNIHKLNFVPTDPLYRKNFGRAFYAIPGEMIIISNRENEHNQQHEFLHGLINPIVDKLFRQLTDEQKQRISELASGQLRGDYGEWPYSLLCEELIRTYQEVVVGDDSIGTFEEFEKRTATLTEEEFMRELRQNGALQDRCKSLGIYTLTDFRNKSREFFDAFKANPMRVVVTDLYRSYINRPDARENFEQFILREFRNRI